MLDLIIRNGLVTSARAERQPLEVGIRDGKFVAMADRLHEDAREIIDAGGKDIFPGFIDPHTHMELPVSGTVSSDDFYTGTVAAACGGITTIIDFAGAVRGQSLMEALGIWQERARAKAVIDYGFHMIVPELDQWQLDEIPDLVDAGVSTVKCMMAYKRGPQGSGDGNLLRVMWTAKGAGASVMVHAENGDAIDVTVDRFLKQGRTGPEWHHRSRPPELEAEAVHRASVLAEFAGSSLYVVHLSSAAALEAVREARRRGVDVLAETCPQYLTLNSEEYLRPGFEAAKYVCSPPLRDDSDRQALWEGIEKGDLQLVASDHCPFFYQGQKDRGLDNFSLIPNGIPTIQPMYSLLFSEGVLRGRISRSRFVELTSAKASSIFGLYPVKGAVEVGADADLVIFDAERTVALSRERASPLRERVDYTPYEGRTVRGWPDIVISRGEIVVRNGEPVFELAAGRGEYVARVGKGKLAAR